MLLSRWNCTSQTTTADNVGNLDGVTGRLDCLDLQDLPDRLVQVVLSAKQV